ncbi:CBM1 domain-containing protein [Mycena indigotica]|uniref:CBM1 domain-containing protein n=1 Tax=Mycena indigotica TaxID=2126181 RepID=A0A8H6SHW6_9AGAR|nr:CBM1 domain-containing protein [Mycena indigotica]KAF7298976.1 CBM1 domain-containing protein [Mycena indigotica]
MGDIQTRPFSKNYSGLINQSVIALGITFVCVTGQELMKRARRGTNYDPKSLGSRESWEFGYLYQGRSWARYPSPPSPKGWPLSWVKQVVFFPADKMNELRGVDATLYVRWLRGCFFFVLLHTLTTFPILFPIHVEFSDNSISKKSMTRASITSLVATHEGLSLLWIHICLLFWITFSWIIILIWICLGAFRLRADKIAIAAKRMAAYDPAEPGYYPHPHPQFGFAEMPKLDSNHPNFGLRLRTVMVANVPPALRDEKTLKEYFAYYLSRKVEKPSMGLPAATQPGFINKSVAFLFNRVKKLPIPPIPLAATHRTPEASDGGESTKDAPEIERVVICRKMTELASLLERREEFARRLETAHIKLAKKTVLAVAHAMDRRDAHKPPSRPPKIKHKGADPEHGLPGQNGTISEEDRISKLIEVVGPFVEEFGLRPRVSQDPRKAPAEGSQDSHGESDSPTYPPISPTKSQRHATIWDALLSLPRGSLDAYQPLVHLSLLFRGKIVPSIDYYTAKFNLISSFITENRAKSITDYDPVSTAFVTFVDPADARRACKYLAVHPNNPLTCLVTMAPQYSDLDWTRIMKSSYNGEFVKDWVVNLGVWQVFFSLSLLGFNISRGFTVFWLFPVSLLVGLVSIQNISSFWPALKSYLDKHQWEEDVIQSFLPTLLVALLALSIPPILLLIAKKAHTITTLSALHDLILTRYYKFLVVNVLVFFCVGTVALQSVLDSFKANQTSNVNILQIVTDSFPTAGPFYVGWLIFTVGMHGGFELALCTSLTLSSLFSSLTIPPSGSPSYRLPDYSTTSDSVRNLPEVCTLHLVQLRRKRAVGIRPRTFNFYYWLPTHLLVIHVLLLFMVLNPFVIPFGAFYFFIEAGVVKNQLIHIYAKNYEGNGQTLLIRMVRYSLDGLIFSQAVFMVYMIVLKKSVNLGLAAFLLVFTAVTKLIMTRIIRAKFEHDDIYEAQVLVPNSMQPEQDNEQQAHDSDDNEDRAAADQQLANANANAFFSWRMPGWAKLTSYATVRPHRKDQHRPNPFGPRNQSFSRLGSMHFDASTVEAANRHENERLIHARHVSNTGPHPDSKEPIISEGGDGAVVPHPPPPIWDDDNTADLPYENPYYARPISNFLWLPRDPFGKLNLEDTVDLKVALSVDTSVGRLGVWQGTQDTVPRQRQMSEVSSVSTPPEEQPIVESPQELDGSEEIDLPLIIAKRARAKEDVEPSDTMRRRRGSNFGRKVSMGSMPRRPSLAPRISSRSVSDGRPRERAASFLSTLTPPSNLDRVQSADWEMGIRPDAHAQADFVLTHSSTSRLSVVPQLRRGTNVSAQVAITHEVMAEEEVALVDRLEEEALHAERATQPRSWFTSWMFKGQRSSNLDATATAPGPPNSP